MAYELINHAYLRQASSNPQAMNAEKFQADTLGETGAFQLPGQVFQLLQISSSLPFQDVLHSLNMSLSCSFNNCVLSI